MYVVPADSGSELVMVNEPSLTVTYQIPAGSEVCVMTICELECTFGFEIVSVFPVVVHEPVGNVL